jgi:fimbrial chaperone protein
MDFRKEKIRGVCLAGALLVAALFSRNASASIVLNGTRIIYDAKASAQSVQMSNRGAGPSVVQVWGDQGDATSSPQTAQVPFTMVPAVFRLAPDAGQVVRVVFTQTEDLPQDRESVFYVNTLQIPSTPETEAGQGKVLLVQRNRLKLFYRPTGLPGRADDAAQQLQFSLVANASGQRCEVAVRNPSAYHVSVIDGALVGAGGKPRHFAADMVKPYAEGRWTMEEGCVRGGSSAPLTLVATYIDDLGATHELRRRLDVGEE